MKKSLLILSLLIISSLSFYSQENPIRIGVKVGFPELAALNLEYVTPLIDSKLAPVIDFTNLTLTEGNGKFVYSLFGIGANYYFGDSGEGKGIYTNLTYSRPSFKLESSNDIESWFSKTTLSMFTIKLGAKLGKRFYFRPEIGYSFVNSADIEVKYSDLNGNFLRFETEEAPVNLGGITGNIGIGFSF